MTRNILIIEDTPSLARTYEGYLRHAGYNTLIAEDAATARAILTNAELDLILLDLQLPDANGIDLMDDIRGACATPVVVITANASLRVAIDAMRAGALDFLVKPFDKTRLYTTIEAALERSSLRQIVSEKVSPKKSTAAVAGFIGESRVMKTIYKTIEAVAASDASVFITGESGTGKEVAAEAIHKASRRQTKAFHAINCGAIPGDLMESELFGHVRGAFTGATSDRDGAAMMANGGTLFLDELGEMPMALQTKLLRFIQQGTFQKVGETRTRKADIRFICATNRNPLEAIANGQLREDLYYRLNVIPIEMPPLRERGNDVSLLAEAFLQAFANEDGKSFDGLDESAVNALCRYSWPGNVRQLQNVIRNAVVLNTGPQLTSDMLPTSLMPGNAGGENKTAGVHHLQPAGPEAIVPLRDVEQLAIEQALQVTGGNIQKAARLLEIDPSTIHRRKKAWAS